MLLRYTKKTQSEIGRIVGGKDHATVEHAKKTINNLCETNKLFNEQFNRINNKVLNYLKPF
jgi:chromosomal replication initiator protein